MAFFVQANFAMGFTRSIGCVGRAGAAAGEWEAYIVGHEDSSTFKITDADDGLGYFLIVPGPNPAGFSPIGDLVSFQSHMPTLVIGFTLAQNPLTTPTVQQGIVFGWVTLPAFPGLTFAVIYTTPPNEGDVLLLCDPSELTLLKKNPAFP